MDKVTQTAKRKLPVMQEIIFKYMERFSEMAPLLPGKEQAFEMTEYAYPIRTGKRALVQEKGFALSLHYIPGDPFEINSPAQEPDENMDPVWRSFCGIYIKIDLYNKTVRKKEFANHAHHYLPIGALDGLFQLYNAIVTDTLFAYYAQKRNLPIQNASDELIALYRQHFQDQSGKQYFDHTHCENYRTVDIPKPLSMFTISYYPINQKGKETLLPWKLACAAMHFRPLTEDELEDLEYRGFVEKPRASFRENGYTTTAIRIPTEDLLTAIESIYYAICQWLDGKLLNTQTNT